MTVDSYYGIPQEEIRANRLTRNGKTYTLDHSKELIVDMHYKGKNVSTSNSQGWEWNRRYFFNQLLDKHPEFFDKKNKARIKNGQSPVVNAHFLEHFPEYKDFENDILIHHHIGGAGQAVAIPHGMHVGWGEIHVVENSIGVRDNAIIISDSVDALAKDNPEIIGKTSGDIKKIMLDKGIYPIADKDDLKKVNGAHKTHVGNRENRIVENEQTMGQMSKQMSRQQSLHEVKSAISREKMKAISKANNMGIKGLTMDHAQVPKVIPDKIR